MATIAFAHRGGPLLAGERLPDNSLPAFRRALAAGARALETDARRSADGHAVLAHDGAARRGLRRRRVASSPAAALAELGVPRLDDLYAELGTGFDLSVDLKTADALDPVLDAAGAAGATHRLHVCSGRVELLVRAAGRGTGARLVHSTRPREVAGSMEGHVARLAEAGIGVVNMRWTDWSPGLVTLVQRFGLAAFAWGTHEVRSLRAALALGVDGLYCDRVDLMLAVVGEFDVDGR